MKQLDEKTLYRLRTEHRRQHGKKAADRLKCVYLLGLGWTMADVATAVMVDESTVGQWWQKFIEGGIAGLLATAYTGKKAKLTDEELAELAVWLEENLCLTTNEIIAHVKKKHRVEYSHSGMADLLGRMGFVYKKPTIVPGKCDPEAQKKFVKKYRRLRKTRGKNDVFLFGDGCHPQHNSMPAYGWIRRGVEKPLKTNSSRKRLNIHGAYDIDRHRIIAEFPKTINAETTILLLKKILKAYPNAGKIHLFVDNASYYRNKNVRAFLHRHRKKLRIYYLPTYSPNLNLIERLWKFFKKKVLANRYYPDFVDFCAAAKSFFRCRKKYLPELTTLMTEKFHLFKVA